jgi:mersacidin/lichenicidin family type 2 lantibiotic
MSQEQIIRAWTDAEYRATLTEEELAQLPENPAGLVELTDEDLDSVSGGNSIFALTCGSTCSSFLGICSAYGCTESGWWGTC